jgi:opacity protein-like surface antigen
MKKLVLAVLVACALIAGATAADAQSFNERKGDFQIGIVAPSIFFGTKNIDAMMSAALEGEYFILNNLTLGFRIEDATDFKMTDPPHNVLSMTARVRYIFDVDDQWKAYLGAGFGAALLGSSQWAADIAVPNVGGYYQFNDNFSLGVDANMHVLVRSQTAFVFSLGPAFRWKF